MKNLKHATNIISTRERMNVEKKSQRKGVKELKESQRRKWENERKNVKRQTEEFSEATKPFKSD